MGGDSFAAAARQQVATELSVLLGQHIVYKDGHCGKEEAQRECSEVSCKEIWEDASLCSYQAKGWASTHQVKHALFSPPHRRWPQQ